MKELGLNEGKATKAEPAPKKSFLSLVILVWNGLINRAGDLFTVYKDPSSFHQPPRKTVFLTSG